MSVFSVVVAGDGFGALRIGDGGASESLRVVNVDSGAVLATLFEAEGTLGGGASARMGEDGAFILELRMITGFDRAETRVVLWSAPNTDSGKGGYSRQAPEFCSAKSTAYFFAVNIVFVVPLDVWVFGLVDQHKQVNSRLGKTRVCVCT